LSVAYLLLNAESYDGEILHTCVTTICRTCAGFYVYGVVVTKIMTFLQKCMQVGRSSDLRSVGGTVGSRPIAAGWLAGCSSVGRYSHVAGESQSDWPCVFNNVGR